MKSVKMQVFVTMAIVIVSVMGMSPEDRARELVNKMTLQEKVRFRSALFFLILSDKDCKKTDTLSSWKRTRVCR